MTKLPVDMRPRLTLEDYILFFTTRTGHGLTMDHLNQIVFMHGFTKFHRHNKPVIVEALNSFDLMRPRRSTVSINAVAPPPCAATASASAAALSTEDVTRDIEDLDWCECPVSSILSVRAGAAASPPTPLATVLPGSGAVERVSPPSILSASSPLPPPPPPAAEKRKRAGKGQGKAAMRRRKKRMVQLLTLPSLESMATPA